jgi:pSer/pThr/pTyr-binding forkhead associated (FHA) protein
MDDEKPTNDEHDLNHPLLNPNDTFIVENKLALRRLLGLPLSAQDEAVEETPIEQIVILHVRGMTERVVLKNNDPMVLGRADVALNFKPDVDLNPYGAATRGVSRSHARIHFEDHHLFITDLDSANGTFIGSEQLKPNQQYKLPSGSNILLGALAIQVTFS